MAMDLDDGKAGGRGDKAPRVSDLAQIYRFPDKKWVTARLMPGLFPYAGYWVTTKKRDGGKATFFVPCPSFDPVSQTRDSTKPDPWRDFEIAWKAANPSDGGNSKKGGKAKGPECPVRFAQEWYMDAIIRSEQKKLSGSKLPRPTPAERKSGFKDLSSDSLTPVYGVKLGRSILGKLQELKGLNVVEGKSGAKAYNVNDAKYGVNIKFFYDKDKAPADQYLLQASETHSPLTEEELGYLRQDLARATALEFDEKDLVAVQADFESWATRNGFQEFLGKKGKKGKKQADDDFEDDLEDEDDEDEPAPKKGKKSPAKKGKKPVDDEDDLDEDDDDFEDDEDEEDDEPTRKSSKKAPVKKAPAKKAPAKKGKKPVDDEDDDEDY